MPEEINRVLTDQIADRLYTTERSAHENLGREGIAADRLCFVGNVMIDSLRGNLGKASSAMKIAMAKGFDAMLLNHPRGYGVVTLHRPSNVDDRHTLKRIVDTLSVVSSRLPLAFAVHPRTRANLERFDLLPSIDPGRTALLPPLGYLDMLGLTAAATLVLTDSGGLQEETTALGIPCLTLRTNTERPITVEEGTNTVVGTDADTIIAAVEEILEGRGKRGRTPELWDGKAAIRIAEDLMQWLSRQNRSSPG